LKCIILGGSSIRDCSKERLGETQPLESTLIAVIETV